MRKAKKSNEKQRKLKIQKGKECTRKKMNKQNNNIKILNNIEEEQIPLSIGSKTFFYIAAIINFDFNINKKMKNKVSSDTNRFRSCYVDSSHMK